jgi:iron(III) transport system substrate-binding protein
MTSMTFLFCALAIATAGLPVHVAFGATLEEALKSLKGLAAKERQPRVESEARKEGIVRWASSTPQAWAEPSLQAFRKRYPGIQIEYMRQSGRVLAERIVREYRAGKPRHRYRRHQRGHVCSNERRGRDRALCIAEAAQLRKDMKDPDGWWVSYFGNIQAIICNKNRVKTAPGDWRDFLDPKWKREFSIDDTRYEWFYALQKIYGAQEANKLISGFIQNGVHLRRGGTLRAQLVGAGEESCGLGVYLNNVHELLEPGAPVNYSVPEPVLVVPVINMMAKLAPHPYTAILLYDFILTPEAMGHYTRANAMAPARDNLPLVQAVRDLQGKRVHVIDVEASSRDYEKTVKEYRALLKK